MTASAISKTAVISERPKTALSPLQCWASRIKISCQRTSLKMPRGVLITRLDIPTQVEKSIRRFHQVAGDRRSLSHSILICLLPCAWEILSQALPQGGSAWSVSHKPDYPSGVNLSCSGDQLSCSHQPVVCGNASASHWTANKSTENWVPAELPVQTDIWEQRWWTCSNCPSQHEGSPPAQLRW